MNFPRHVYITAPLQICEGSVIKVRVLPTASSPVKSWNEELNTPVKFEKQLPGVLLTMQPKVHQYIQVCDKLLSFRKTYMRTYLVLKLRMGLFGLEYIMLFLPKVWVGNFFKAPLLFCYLLEVFLTICGRKIYSAAVQYLT